MFAGGTEITREIFEEFLRTYRAKKYLKQSLSRLINGGFILKEGAFLKLTKEGENRLLKSTLKREVNMSWDGKWRIISFDVPGGYSPERNKLRALLKHFNFYQLQKSVWVCPNSVAEKFWKLVIEENLQRYCKAMVVEIMEGDENLKKYFKLNSKR